MKQSSGARPVRSCSAAIALARAAASGSPVHGVHGMGVLHDGFGFVALELADEVPAQLPRPAPAAAAFSAASWSRFSPTSVTPRAASRRTSSAGWNLVTTISRGGRSCRPAAATALSMRCRTAASRSRSCSSRGSGCPARARVQHPLIRSCAHSLRRPRPAVPASSTRVRRTVRCSGRGGRRTGVRLPGCSCRSIRPLTPASCSWLRTAAGRSRPGVPREVVHQAAGTRAATSSRMSSGTS